MMKIRQMQQGDYSAVIEMMRNFYASPALIYHGGDAVYERTLAACLDDTNPFVECWVFEEDDTLIGYSILAHSFSTEYGMKCIWVEDLYLKEEARGKGKADQFFAALKRKWEDIPVRFRLEVEAENQHACQVYRKNNWSDMGYISMETISDAGASMLDMKC